MALVPLRHTRTAAVIVGLLAAGPLFAQTPPGAVGSALGAAPQPKLAAPPAPATVTPGSGADMDSATRAAALKAAIERCDLMQTLALGGSAEDAARIQVAVGRVGNVVPGTAAWVQTNGVLALAARQTTGGARLLAVGQLRGFTPPGGIAGLPTAGELFGPNPALNQEFAKLFIQGMSAQDVAAAWLGRPAFPRPRDSSAADDPAQAYYLPSSGTNGAVNLFIPRFSTTGPLDPSMIPLPGTEALAGRADVLQQTPQIQVPAWVKDLPPPPLPSPPPPPVTQC